MEVLFIFLRQRRFLFITPRFIWGRRYDISLKLRRSLPYSENIPFIPHNTIFPKQLPVFIFKAYFGMMLLLIFYVVYCPLFISCAIGQGTRSFSPVFKIGKIPRFLHPFVGCCFYLFNIICQTDGRVQVGKDMNVVFGAINSVQYTISIFYYSPDIFI